MEEFTRLDREDMARERFTGAWRRKHIQQILTSQVYAGHDCDAGFGHALVEQFAARLGAKGFDLIGPNDWPILKAAGRRTGLITTVNARIGEVVFGATDPKAGALGSLAATDAAPFGSGTWSYPRTIAVPTWNCIRVTNTATIVETGASASALVEACGPARTGARPSTQPKEAVHDPTRACRDGGHRWRRDRRQHRLPARAPRGPPAAAPARSRSAARGWRSRARTRRASVPTSRRAAVR